MATKEDIEVDGELFASFWEISWIDGAEVSAGTAIVPIVAEETELTIEHAALSLAIDDLELALFAFGGAARLGTPDSQNLTSKALIYSATVAYARSFSGGVRGFNLDASYFQSIWSNKHQELHGYLFALRNKHIAHAVTGFERSQTIGVVTTDLSTLILSTTTPSGVGVTKMSMIGIPMIRLRACPAHVARMIEFLRTRITTLRPLIHADLVSRLKVGETVQMAPLMTLPDRSQIGQRRR